MTINDSIANIHVQFQWGIINIWYWAFVFSVDIDECLNTTNPVCEQDCTNNIGGYTCSCQLGFRFIEGHCLGELNCSVNKCVPIISVVAHVLANVDTGSWEDNA